MEYARELSDYLQTLEQRLFSEGLHTLGHAPTAAETEQYLAAYFGDDLPPDVSITSTFVQYNRLVEIRHDLHRVVSVAYSGSLCWISVGIPAFSRVTCLQRCAAFYDAALDMATTVLLPPLLFISRQ